MRPSPVAPKLYLANVVVPNCDFWEIRSLAWRDAVHLRYQRDSRPDVIQTYRNGDLIKIERKRKFDGRVDRLEEYEMGKAGSKGKDDNCDGKPGNDKHLRQWQARDCLALSPANAARSIGRTTTMIWVNWSAARLVSRQRAGSAPDSMRRPRPGPR